MVRTHAKLITAAAGLAVGALVLSSCSSGDAAPPTESASASASATAPVEGSVPATLVGMPSTT